MNWRHGSIAWAFASLILAALGGCSSSGEPDSPTPPLIAYVEWTPYVDTMRVVTMLPDGSDRRVRYTGPQYEQVDGLAPSPRGDRLLFRTASGAGYQWYSVSLPDGDAEPIAAPPDVSVAVVSPRDNEIAWFVLGGGGWIGLAAPGSATIRRITPDDWLVPFPAVWSPDGNRMVVTRMEPETGDFDLYIVTRTGSITPLIVQEGYDYAPDWSEAAGLIAFSRDGEPANQGLYIVEPDGPGFRRVVSGAYTGAFWSPDGKTLLTKRLTPSGPGDLLTVDVATGAVTPIALSEEFMSSWSTPWSPGGQEVLSGKYGTAGFQVLMLNNLDAAPAQLTPDTLIVQQAVWLP